MKLRTVRVKAFESATLAPAEPADGTSLVELIDTWRDDLQDTDSELELIEVQYRTLSGAAKPYTATVWYSN